jgi:RNA polymerase sigma-70 factor (ECF subfamily)
MSERLGISAATGSGPHPIEGEIRRQHAARNYEFATELALRAYGREILGLLVALHGNEADASDAFGDFCEHLWTGLPDFRWDCSLRTWMYAVARRASSRFRQSPERRPERNVPLSQYSSLSRLQAEMRSETRTYLREETKGKLAQLRASLSAEDQLLLILRVDRQMAWKDLAHVMLDDRGGASDEDLRRESARLRKRFELVKKKLRDAGIREGLWDERGRPVGRGG